MTNENGLNDTILSARNYTISETAAGSGNMDGPTATSVSLPAVQARLLQMELGH